MKCKTRIRFAILLGICCAPLAVWASSVSPPIRLAPAQIESLGVRTAEVEPVTDAWGAVYPAEVRVPNAQLRVVSAPQEGLLAALLVAEGEAVAEGRVVAVIQSPQLVAQQGAYLEAVTNLRLADVELRRDRKLKAEGIIAERRYLETRARRARAETTLEQLRQALMLAGMDEGALEELTRRRKLSSTLEVRSPLTGVVLEQMATPGQRLEVATPLYRIGRLDPLWLEIHVPLERLGETAAGTPVRVDLPEASGKVITVGSMVHGEDQGVLVRAQVHHGAEALRPGQFVQARIAQTSGGKAFRISRNALVRHRGGTWVLVAREGGFEPREVTPRSEEAGHLVVEGGLRAGDRLAVAGTAALKAAWLEGEE